MSTSIQVTPLGLPDLYWHTSLASDIHTCNHNHNHNPKGRIRVTPGEGHIGPGRPPGWEKGLIPKRITPRRQKEWCKKGKECGDCGGNCIGSCYHVSWRTSSKVGGRLLAAGFYGRQQLGHQSVIYVAIFGKGPRFTTGFYVGNLNML